MHKLCLCKPYQNSLVKTATQLVRFKSNNESVAIVTDFQDRDEIKRPIYTPESPVSVGRPPTISKLTSPASLECPPTTCCMSGCANCVYIEWAEALSKQMSTADPELARKILSTVTDSSMKAFLTMELRNIGVIK